MAKTCKSSLKKIGREGERERETHLHFSTCFSPVIGDASPKWRGLILESKLKEDAIVVIFSTLACCNQFMDSNFSNVHQIYLEHGHYESTKETTLTLTLIVSPFSLRI